MLQRAYEKPVSRDGAVIRETTISHLESKDFQFRRLHLEFAAELDGSTASVLTKFSPSFATGKDCFFRHVRGMCFIFNRKSVILSYCQKSLWNFTKLLN